jgi:hypothetical protein
MTFRNLPLTPEQDAEVRAYIEGCKARGEPWDVLELCYILGVYPRSPCVRIVVASIENLGGGDER